MNGDLVARGTSSKPSCAVQPDPDTGIAEFQASLLSESELGLAGGLRPRDWDVTLQWNGMR